MNLSPNEELRQRLESLTLEETARILQYYQLLLEENENQNLTRLTSPGEFMDGHLCDVIELLKSEMVDYPAADLGSGGGIPGLLGAMIAKQAWVLVESEKRKAEFLRNAVAELGLGELVQVSSERIEQYLKKSKVNSIVARAVGPVDRIYSWIRSCSTWNNLVLLKGPGWEEEWKRFQETKYKKELKIVSIHSYVVGPEKKVRKIVKLVRVPRRAQ